MLVEECASCGVAEAWAKELCVAERCWVGVAGEAWSDVEGKSGELPGVC
jgi:hypothetical protein